MENEKKQVAIIDCGSNTFNLLIAELSAKGFKQVHKDKISVQLGEDSDNMNHIPEKGMQRALGAIETYHREIKRRNIDEVIVFATSAVRDAKNKMEFVEKVKKNANYDVQIIDGDREADLIYKGVKNSFKMDEEKYMIVDIGGGSTEFIIGNFESIFWKKSYQLGITRLWEKFKPHDPLKVEEISTLEKYIWEEIDELKEALLKYPCKKLIGSSGSFETLADIIDYKNDPNFQVNEENTFRSISTADFMEMHQQLIHSSGEERSKMKGMLKMRVKTFAIVSIFIHLCVEGFKFDTIHVSNYSLIEGILAEKMAENLDLYRGLNQQTSYP